jgi:hypothetical protein
MMTDRERISTGRSAQRAMAMIVIMTGLIAAFLCGAAADHLGYLGP